MSAVLEVRGLDKRFGGIVVADAIDLTLSAGRVVGLIGPNGAGKTSLFNLVSGIFPADAGTITLQGERIDRLKTHRRAARGLSRTWQNLRLFPSLSVLDNLMVGPRRYPGEKMWRLALGRAGIRQEEAQTRRRALEILERTGLAGVARTRAADLTFGQQKLVGVARALMNEARCLLLDEPMAGVSPTLRVQLLQHVLELRERNGVTFLIVEHDLDLVMRVSDVVVVMNEGRVIASGRPAAVSADPRVVDAYLGAPP